MVKMASSDSAQVPALEKYIRNYLQCRICKKEYTEPKLLDCDHSFCKHCLLKYQTINYKDARMLICPRCKQETQLPESGIEDLKTNLILNSLAVQLEQVCSSQNNNFIICIWCFDEQEATHCCFDCPLILCANCYKMYHESREVELDESHNVVSGKDIPDGKINVEPRWELLGKFDTRMLTKDVALLPGDEVAVLCFKSNAHRMAIYDMKGQHEKPIQLSQHHRLKSVAAFMDQLVVVDKSNLVKMYNKNGTKRFEFYTVPPSEVGNTAINLCSVAVKKDTIIIGDIGRSVITKHSSSDGSLIDTVSVETKPWYLAIDSKDRVVISGLLQLQHVVIVDDNGATPITIKPTINGQQVDSTGVCCDSSAIYIAMHTEDYNTGHIHQYDTEGRFLSCIARGLYWPWGISLTSDGQQLAVADDKSVKIYNKM